tara:strand:- start:375 stop:1073 length:699 start_codon:yes stop_codon:yes gene_type:complete
MIFIPILAGLGSAAVATALGATALTAGVVGVGTAVGVNSMMNQTPTAPVVTPVVAPVDTLETDTTEVDITAETGGVETTINEVGAVQTVLEETVDTTVETELTEEVVGEEVTTLLDNSGVITDIVNTETGEAVVEVAPGTTSSGGVLVGGSTTTSESTAASGVAEAVVATTQSTGPAETEAISFFEKGRRSTILTSAQGIPSTAAGLLSDVSGAGLSMLRQRRGLVGQGLIA